MALEIERKFLVRDCSWRGDSPGVPLAQGYLAQHNGKTVRVRIAGNEAFLTIKGASLGLSRLEFEYPIPVADAREMLTLCEGGLIDKTRHCIPHGDHLWEIDVFHGENEGLIVAEIELDHPEEAFQRPSWLGAEVSHDLRYSNVQLTRNPFRSWPSA
jgi:adenylate cyclase